MWCINKIFVIYFTKFAVFLWFFLPKFAIFSQSCEETWWSFVKFFRSLRLVLRFFDENCDFFCIFWQTYDFLGIFWRNGLCFGNYLTKFVVFLRSIDEIRCFSTAVYRNMQFFKIREIDLSHGMILKFVSWFITSWFIIRNLKLYIFCDGSKKNN